VAHAPYIRGSVAEIRGELVAVRKQLQGGRDAAEWIDAMTKACRTYLDAVEGFDYEAEVEPKFEPALRELRELFRTAGKHFRTHYGLHRSRHVREGDVSRRP
jgi:hypothetical protein